MTTSVFDLMPGDIAVGLVGDQPKQEFGPQKRTSLRRAWRRRLQYERDRLCPMPES